jgi:predicted double-glycine peptidase
MVRPDLPPPQPNYNGLTPETFTQWAESHGVLRSAGYRESVAELEPGAIVLIDIGTTTHYVVVTKITQRSVYVHDPSTGKRRYTKKTFPEIWFRKWMMLLVNS